MMDTISKLTREEKAALTAAKRADKAKLIQQKHAEAGISEDGIDALIYELEAINITPGKYKGIIRRYRKAYPDLMKEIANSVDMMDRIPPMPCDDPIDMSVIVGNTTNTKSQTSLVGYHNYKGTDK